ncbi:pyridoxal phosphate-dependent aminotransferase [Bradyrhizobium yuanmingense]|uniref:pyridoxal phosphate-dependent aminotransferase n=1 Tax=Bradyrhizobium yuanmingense TaxID=108015 RepID=UPI0023BA2ED1|nr:aminotransferase class I/II-fold pyridoxal phosphate-dependent enzyme [Bradyrhizobium yuanmingense]MDF0581969.1 aminotransferase class I/II-fold pyridoxal phosphate-dependent enzyme [Bradyrhizobium yuanmingense]
MFAQRMSFLSDEEAAFSHKRGTPAAAPVNGEIIDLAGDEITIEASSSECEAALASIKTGTDYAGGPIGLAPLRTAVAETLSATTSMDWGAEDIVITSGAREALLTVTLALLDPGDEVIVLRPCWSTFPSQVLLSGATPVFVDAFRPRYNPDLSSVRAAVTPRTKAIFINSPNNPTGAIYGRTTLQNIGELAIHFQLWIISAEYYSRFVFTGRHRHYSIVLAHPGVRSRTIMINAFSERLAITGWRLAYFAAPAEFVLAARKLHRSAISPPNAIAQNATLHHLRLGDCTFERQLYQRLADARNMGLYILSDLRDVAPPRADGSFFFYLDLSRLISALPTDGPIQSADDLARLLLKKSNVKCASGRPFGDVNGLRLSFGVQPDLLKEGLRRIVNTLNSLRSAKF